MPPSKEQILESLERIPAPNGRPLPQTGTLSEIVVSEGKVFFSMTVDAAAVKAWEPVRKRAEEAVRAVPRRAVGADRADGGAGRRRRRDESGGPRCAANRPGSAASGAGA